MNSYQVFISGDAGGPFDIYYDSISVGTQLATGVSRNSLLVGYTVGGIPDSASSIIVYNTDSGCNNSVTYFIKPPTPTPTPTATPTPTPTPQPPDCTLAGGVITIATPTPTPTPTLTPTPTATPTITPTPTPTATLPPSSYDYYISDEWDCNTCQATGNNVVVAVIAGSSITTGKFYITGTTPGYVYRITGVDISGSPGLIVSSVPYDICSQACAVLNLI